MSRQNSWSGWTHAIVVSGCLTAWMGSSGQSLRAEEFPQGFPPANGAAGTVSASGAAANDNGTGQVAAQAGATAAVGEVTPAAPANSSNPEQSADQPKATPDSIAQWIKELDHDDFKIRQTAAQRLTAAGQMAIEPLVAAVQSGKLEVMAQGLGIVRKFFESNEPELKAAAKNALEKIAKGNDATAAQRANEILSPPPPVDRAKLASNDPFGQPAQIQLAPGQQIQGGAIIIRNGNIIPQQRLVPAAIQGRIAVQAQAIANNGEHKVRVNENGRQIEIDRNAQEIRVALIEDGKTSEFKAKNIEELKKNHPEGYKLYQQYNQGGAIAFGNAVPANVPAGFPQPAVNAHEVRLRMAEQMLQHAEKVVQQTANETEHKDAFKETLAKIQAAQAELKAAKEKLANPVAEEKPTVEKPAEAKAAAAEVQPKVESPSEAKAKEPPTAAANSTEASAKATAEAAADGK